jgi:uncharacterized protein DUF5947
VTAAGLRRYARAEPAAAPAPPPAVAERCGLCGADLGGRHGHVVALDDRALRCTCRPCYLLFTPAGAAGGRIRAVPERYLTDPERPIADSDWDRLQIPVTTAFFFVNSDVGRVVACYPSPAGVTESLLDLAGWERLRQSYPLLSRPEPDVEAIYATSAGPAIEAYLIPIDACFALAGAVRLRWQGIDGGPDVRQALAEFRDDLRRRSRPYGAG